MNQSTDRESNTSGDGLRDSDESLRDLVDKVVHGFVSSLQADTVDMWQSFNEILQIVQPYSALIEGNAQLMHYVERTYWHVCTYPTCGLDLNALTLAFPQEISKLQQKGKATNSKKVKFPSGSPEVSLTRSPLKKLDGKKGVSVPKGKIIPTSDIYDDNIDDLGYALPNKELQIEDLRRSLPFVVHEIGLREASWGKPLGITTTALNTDLADLVPGPTSSHDSGSHQTDNTSPDRLKLVQDDKSAKEEKTARRPLTGQEIVAKFVKGNFLGKTKFAYLNRAPSKHFEPYNLVAVPRSKIEPEHYVVSTHAILHVMPNSPSELQPLAEWYQEALLFNAISKFNFFRNFMLSKMFLRWRRVKKVSQVRALREQVAQAMVSSTPSFGCALLRIYSLIQDLDQVRFLEFDDLRCKPLKEFNAITSKVLNDAQECVKMFFAYVLSVISKTNENCFEYLEYCKEQLRKKSENPKESLSLAKERKAIKEQNLKHAHHEIHLLQKFVRLVEQILAAKLLAIAQHNIGTFVDRVLGSDEIKDQGLFSVSLIFDRADRLVLTPSCKTIHESLFFAIRSVSKILSQSLESLEMECGSSGESLNLVEDHSTIASRFSQRSDSKQSDGTTPNGRRLSIPAELSPLLSTSSNSLPTSSVCALEPRGDTAADAIEQDNRVEHLKNLLEESFQETLQSSEKDEEEVPCKSAKACISVTCGLLVKGREINLQAGLTNPLSKAKLESRILKDEKILEAIQKQDEIVNTALDEVNVFCREHEWIVEINKFVRTWNTAVLASWRGQPPGKIQEQLSQIKTWIDDLSHVTKSFCTTNGLLFVDCNSIHKNVAPKLSEIFRQLSKMVAKHLLVISRDFSNEVTQLTQKLSEHSRDPKAFAEFMAIQKDIKARVPSLQTKVEYIKSLFEMIRTGYRQLTHDEEEAEETTWASWERFLLSLQEASDFVLIETAQVLRDLEDTLMTLEHQARVIGLKAISGEYLIPENDPTMVLSQLRQLRQMFCSMLNQLDELAKCREVICEKKYEKSDLLDILGQVDVRYQLWKYYHVTIHVIKDWLQMPFRKMNVKKVMEKITEWQLAAKNLKASLVEGDEVYESWMKSIESFMTNFPLLQQLSSDALKQRHWRALFVGMGQQYDADWQFTIADLYSFKLGLYKDLIHSICSGALREYALELELRSLAKLWTDKDFKLAKHFARTKSQLDGETESLPGKSPTRQRNRSRQSGKPRTADMYILTGDDELKCLIEDNRVVLQLMMASPYVADLKPTVGMWMKNLEQLEEILELWVACQKKWLYLSLVFSEDSEAYSKAALDQFEQVDTRFKEFMQSVVRDPKVLSILAKKRGEKGYRELHGEALRSYLFALLKAQEELLKSVQSNMEKVRQTFPRLYFLSDNEVLDTIVISRDPRKLVPVVRKCFPGIKSPKFGLPKDDTTKLSSVLDASLNAHLLQVTAIEGDFGEIMVLPEPIAACMDSQTWLTALEMSMKSTLMVNLTKCMLNWLSQDKHGTTAVSDILNINKCEKTDVANQTEETSNTRPKPVSWLLKYPSQCIRIAEAATWSQDVYYALSSNDRNELKALSLFTNRRVEDYSKVLGRKKYMFLTSTARVRQTLESLVVCAIHQRDVVERLLACEAVCIHCFEWQSCFQHHVSLKRVFSTTYCSGLPGTSRHQSLQDHIPLDVKYETEEYNIHVLGSQLPYGFEYLSEKASLIVTPLTERCFLTLSMALKQYYCGVPFGYSGTGKTETISELAKMMGRHLVFFRCSHSMVNSVATRLLTGMVSSGSWICFDEANNLSQWVLSILGEYLGCIRESYKCLIINKGNQYSIRNPSRTDAKMQELSYLQRRNSVTSLNSLASEEPNLEGPKDGVFSNKIKKSTKISRRFSIAECRNINQSRYYQDEQPLPISIPLTPKASLTDCELFSHEKEDKVSYQQPSDLFLGHIVFNGMFLRAHHMAGCFMTIAPTSDGFLHVPDNLKVSLRTVAMVLPDVKRIIEVLLLYNGFSDVGPLAEKVAFFAKVIREQLLSKCDIQTSALKTAIYVAGNKLRLERSISDATKDKVTESKVELEVQSSDEVEVCSSTTSFLDDFENRTREESAVVYGIFSILCPKLDEETMKQVCHVMDTVFTHTVLTSSIQTKAERVTQAVREQLSAESLQPTMDFVSKVVQLYQVLETNRAVIIVGSSGTGKTTIYQTLCRAINSLNSQIAHSTCVGGVTHPDSCSEKERRYPKINLSVLFPGALSENELFGSIDPVTNLWVDGILINRVRNAEAVKNASESLSSNTNREKPDNVSHTTGKYVCRSDLHQWIVLDGPLDSGCMDQINSLFGGSQLLSLGNGEVVTMSETLSFLLEVDDLENAAPSVVSRCGIVYCPDDTVGWKSIFKSWLKGAHGKWNISIRGLGVLSSLMEHCVEKTLAFLSNQCTSVLSADYYDSQRRRMGARGVHEVQRLLAILSSLFDKHILRDNDETFDILDHIKDQRYSISRSSSDTGSGRSSSIPASDTATVISSFAYAFIWAFGGDQHESCIGAFDEFVKGLLTTGPHPHSKLPPVTVFDYHLDFPTGSLLSSTEKFSGATRTIGSSYVVVPRAEVYFSLLDLLIAANKPVLLVGPPGSGKTSFMQNLISPRYKYTRISLANGMPTQLLQETIETKIRQAKQRPPVVNNSSPLVQTSCNSFFLDDLNLAATDGNASNNQPSLELLRSLLSLGGLYDRQRLCLKPISETSIIGASVPPGCPGVGGGVCSFPLSQRLARLMVILSFFPVSGATLRSIYRNLFQAWLEDFPAYSLTHHYQLAKAVSDSTVSLFEMISKDLRPTPLHPHYIFTHHDVARVWQGMMLFSTRTKSRPRPKVRRGRRQVAETAQQSKEGAVLVNQSSSCHGVERKDCSGNKNVHQDKSWPAVTHKETVVNLNSKTPAVLAPLIRVILRLWCHECTRVFSDRLIAEDKLWFSSSLHKTAIQHFCETSLSADDQEQESVAFGRERIAPAETNDQDPVNTLEAREGVDEDAETTEQESEENESLSSDDVSPELEQKTEREKLDVENSGEEVIRGDDEAADKSGRDISLSPQGVPQSHGKEKQTDIPFTDDDSCDELKFNSQEVSIPRTAPSKQRVVTFEDMNREHVYRGPLISSEQLIEPGEDLSRLIFCRNFIPTTQESGPEQDKGYNEFSVTALAEGLKRSQQLYNSREVQSLDLVFFEQAVRHAARLSRCLCLSSGHGLLLSKSGHGRKSLVLLASFVANCKLIELRNNDRDESRRRMRSAIFQAGLQGKSVVLYVPENIDRETMQGVCSLMSEGMCPGLFTQNELTTVFRELIPGGQKGRRIENMAIAQERFLRRVRNNLHVFLCLEYERPSTLDSPVFSEFPFLLTRVSAVDVYQPWYPSVLTKVSSLRLAGVNMEPEVQDIVNCHRVTVASLMSYIHTSSCDLITRQFGFNRYKCYSPATFIELVDIYGKCCYRIWKREQAKIERCKEALAKVEVANDQVNEMQKDLDSFIPILRKAEQEVKSCLQTVESLQDEYSKGREKCKQQEAEIEKMMAPIEELERLAKLELDKVSPIFRSAYDALQALNVYDVEEIRSYRTPPDQVVLVVNAVCLLFGKEECWEEGKVLFSREDFIKDLEFFNMKEISDKTFRRLKDYVGNPKFVPESVKEGSLAAMSLCVWIRAVYKFCVVYREYYPKQQRVVEAKKILEEAVVFLGDLRVRCNDIKTEVEAKIEEYKEKVHHARSIEKQIQITEQRKSRAVALLQSMSTYVKSWEESLRVSQHHIKTLAGDALLTAACLCYLGPMDQQARDKLLRDWKMACRGTASDDIDDDHGEDVEGDTVNDASSTCYGETTAKVPLLGIKRVPVRSDFSLKEVLGNEEELYNWRHSGLPANTIAVENALLMRFIGDLASKHWPLLIDTDLQSYMWIKCLHQGTHTKDQEDSDILESNVPSATPIIEDGPLSSPASASPASRDNESGDDRSTNYEESDSTQVHSSQGRRRTSTGACSEPLIREDLAKELDIQTSPVDNASTESVLTDADFDDEQIMIISASDKQRDTKLCGAISIGATVILVDVERRNLGARLDNLLARNTFIEKSGKRKIMIGSRCIDYHPSFRLYLYTNVPLELGTDVISSPFKKCLVLNMAVSSEGLQEHLLIDVLALERPEYESQRRSLEADIRHLEQQVKNAENAVFHRVINLQEKLLENSTLPESLKESDELCDSARQQLEESKALFELAKENEEDYAHVSEHGAALLLIASKLPKLNSCYQMPLQTSLRLIHDVINQRRRGKRSSGSSLARSAELITYITRSMCSKIKRSVFSDHYDVFTLLVATEKLRLAGQITEEEWELFSRTPTRILRGRRPSVDVVDENIPSWVPPEVWNDVLELDHLPSFHGLKESIQNKGEIWKEYFELPPMLMAPTPGSFNHLSVFQRALLWKTFKKEKFHSVCKDLVLYQLGTNATSVTRSSVDEAYQDSTCITPLIFLMPRVQHKGNWRKQNLNDPVDEIVALAKRKKMCDKLRLVTVGGERQITKATHVLRHACENGLWIVFQNCHLVAEWSPALLDIFHQITLAGSKEQIMNKHDILGTETTPYAVTSCLFTQSLSVHPQFRLWLITFPETGTPLPAVIIRNGIKLAWDDKLDFQSSVRQSFTTAWNEQKCSNEHFKELQTKDFQDEPLFPYVRLLALFHSTLHHRCQYGTSAFSIPYQWRYSDMSWGLEGVRLLKSSVLCTCPATASQNHALHQTMSILYGGQVLDSLDWEMLAALSEKQFTTPLQTVEELAAQNTEQNNDVLFGRSSFTLELNDIGLNEKITAEHDIRISNQQATNISITDGISPKLNYKLEPISYFQEIIDAVVDINSAMHVENRNTGDETKSAFHVFLESEKRGYLALLATIKSQVEGVISGLKGDVSFTSDMRELAVILCDDKVPRHWYHRSRMRPSLADWIESLKRQVLAINEYSQHLPGPPHIINVAAFLNKQCLFYALLTDWSKGNGRSVDTMDISIELLPSTAIPQQTAPYGVYLTGLVLHDASWNETENCLEEPKKFDDVMPCLLLKPNDREENVPICNERGRLFYTYNCPVYFYDLPLKSRQLSPSFYVPLPSRVPCHIWQQRQVFLTCLTM